MRARILAEENRAGLMTVGMTLIALQLALFSQLGADTFYWQLLPCLLIGGAGIGADDDAERRRRDAGGSR